MARPPAPASLVQILNSAGQRGDRIINHRFTAFIEHEVVFFYFLLINNSNMMFFLFSHLTSLLVAGQA